ncbi:MAG TPA: hypothetical protein VLT33_03710, partial [Labilithrix sp.]|nr:hypothetical protein [Labilithrix sp.]
MKISQPVRLEFECRDYCSEYALRVVNVSCPDGSCAVQNKREIIALRAGVHAVFEVAVLSRSRNEQILTGTFEADATDLRLVIAIDRTPLPALSPVGYRSESAFLVGSQFRVTIGDTRCPPGSDSYECNGFVPTNGFTLSADVAAVRLSRHEDPRPGWFWYDGFAEQSGRATFEARNNAGPIPIDPPSSVEVGTADDVVEQWLLTSYPSNRACANIASATIAGARCISTEPMVVFEDPPGFSANVTSLVRLRSGTYLYGGAMATTLEPDQGPVDTTDI